MSRFLSLCGCLGACLTLSVPAAGDSWPQFRGIRGAGHYSSEKPLPTEIGPDQNVLWKVALPAGHASPILTEERIFLSAVREGKLVTLALDRRSGKLLWEAQAAATKLEDIHRIGSHAQCTPATDGERVISFFGSSGLYCYDLDGNLIWKRAMGPFNNDFGAGTSPVIVGTLVILCQDHDTDSFLLAVDKRTGETVWKTDRGEFPRNYCSPVLWEHEGHQQIVIAATMRVVGYDLATGKEMWTVRGLSRAVCMTPVVAADNHLVVAGWAGGGDLEGRISVAPFGEVAPQRDANQNGSLEEDELAEESPLLPRFSQVDRDKTGSITKSEYEYYRELFDRAENKVLKIRPGGRGDVTQSHVVWEYRRFVPFCASPLETNDCVFTIKDGGILSCLDSKTGKRVRTKRLQANGSYYSSPVTGDGKIYLVDQRGGLTVVSADRSCQILHRVDLQEDVYGTPALVDGNVYLRTNGHMYCFGKP